jgi:hypothetical protein
MATQKPVDFESINTASVVEDMEKTIKEKGSRSLTVEANACVEHSPILKAIAEVVEEPFECVLLSPWKDKSVNLVVMKLNHEILTAKLPAPVQARLAIIAAEFEKMGSRASAFNAFKVMIVGGTVGKFTIEGELTKALRKGSDGSIVLETPEDNGPRAIRFEFNGHWTTEERLQASAARREKQNTQSTGDYRNRMREKVNQK